MLIEVTPLDGRFCLTRRNGAKLTRLGDVLLWDDPAEARRFADALTAKEDAALRTAVLEGDLQSKVPGPIKARLRDDPSPVTMALLRDYLRQW